ncbi:poly-gamma-glutamate hydrolase family protein, partial [Staphylococcus auricularis]|uniref:poly-gamma-glutamate hydrolase family protein n=1 Tax=Staphylococcus auricularis TaxID=29379 RepID=UPI0012493264
MIFILKHPLSNTTFLTIPHLYHSITQLITKQKHYKFQYYHQPTHNFITPIHPPPIHSATSQLPQSIPQKSRSNYFTFKPIKKQNNYHFHLTST